jgi:putative resolvase
LAVAAVRVSQRTVLVNPDSAGGLVLVVWVGVRGWCSRDQGDDLDGQVAGLSGWAAHAGGAVVPVQAEVGSAMIGAAHSAVIAG